MHLEERINDIIARETTDRDEAVRAFSDLLDALNAGRVRAASRASDGTWSVNAFVKEGILLGFRLGELERIEGRPAVFFDKSTYPLKPLDLADGVRVVPGGSSIRTGSFVAPGVVCMPPMYINVGAYVDEGSMVDSHALVGSCAQIGRNVHLSAAAQIGGVLEPIGAMPVIVEDDVFVGGGCGIYEGCIIRERAVLAPGVILTSATRIYDLVNQRVIEKQPGGSLEVPAGAVVVPGTRSASGAFAAEHGISLYAPVIVKYRDERTAASTTLETALR
jgi:2,3,4,5-tetrahydropyridine-2,6-dicarboxylate N-succinyltransferase